MRIYRTVILLLLIKSTCVGMAGAFDTVFSTSSASRWNSTTFGSTGTPGSPATFSWSIVPDGTLTSQLQGGALVPSNFIAQFDLKFGSGPGGSDLTQRPWFEYFEESFAQMSSVSGVEYVYEPADDGANYPNSGGITGVRGDIRIGGLNSDGVGNTLAYNFFPNGGGDMVIDTADLCGGLIGNGGSDFAKLRNTIMHEAAHGLGMDHIESSNSRFLLEPVISSQTFFVGPQHDDVRGLHWLYGDALEKGVNGRNDTAANATDLETIIAGDTLALGTHGGQKKLLVTETDLVSISDADDQDYFKFTIDQPVWLDLSLTPMGVTYDQDGSNIDSRVAIDLSVSLLDQDGASPIDSSSAAGLGGAESIDMVLLEDTGDYFVKVESAQSTFGLQTQLYMLELATAGYLAGDYDLNGTVEADDFIAWRNQTGATGDWLAADGNRDGVVDGADYAFLRNLLSNPVAETALASAVPEPSAVMVSMLLAAVGGFHRRRR